MSKHEDAVKAKIDARCAAGLAKYGATVERTDLTRLQWLQHAQDEAMDLAIYLQRLIDDESSERREAPAEERIDWAAYPWARWAAADHGGKVHLYGDTPYLSPAADAMHEVQQWWCKGVKWEYCRNAHIPGPWTQSLRRRPEGV